VNLRLTLLAARLAVCRLAPDDAVPESAWSGGFCSVTRTPHELSIVCDEAAAPSRGRLECGWRAMVVAGQLDFGLVGVIASLAAPLAAKGVPIFVLSTFDTDYLLVKETRLAEAITVLEDAGHSLV
jgi:uncharacterized protein